jgi:Na+/H+ antiporter NhaD/arsenite permease-like protein
MIPFGLMLLTIAVAPLVVNEWWESNRHKLAIALMLAIPTAVFLLMGGMCHELEHQLFGDYIPFIVLLLALYVITGGIHLSGDIKAKPWVNTTFLAVGWLFASVMGTTGAAMLLIRPLLMTNQQRKYKVHTVLFFIALVANCGGLLTPLGDPPLFMLFLRGAEFGWFMKLFPQWLFVGVVLLLLYFVFDTMLYKKEHPTNLELDLREHTPLRLQGKTNLFYLVGVVLAVALIHPGNIPMMAEADAHLWIKYLREIVLLVFTSMSLYTTKRKVRYRLNKFSWEPIMEVAILFFGIFITMTPALSYLNDNAETLGFTKAWQFYYATGALSSFLDNTPTAVAFHSVASGLSAEQMANFGGAIVAGIPEMLMRAICLGSVLFGSMTYIGNGPNFMVKAIAEENGVKMPSFFGYIFKFAIVVLLPVYILAQLIFL